MVKQMKNGQTLGTALLSIEAGFAEWSALNPSLFTISKFTETQEDVQNIRDGMFAALAMMGVTSVAIKLAFGKKGTIPAITHIGTGIALFTLYGFRLGWNRLLGQSSQ